MILRYFWAMGMPMPFAMAMAMAMARAISMKVIVGRALPLALGKRKWNFIKHEVKKVMVQVIYDLN